MTRVAIIAAMEGELRPLVRGWQRESRNGVDLWRRRHGGGEWIAACAGAGAQAAARAFAEAGRDGALDLAVSVGWAGALRAEFAAGRAYRVAGVIDAETGERFTVPDSPGGCWLVTSRGVAGRAQKRLLAEAYGAGLVDMEAAAVARLARERAVRFCCIKGVSDGAEEGLPDFNGFFSADGRFQWARFIPFAVARPWHWPALMRMGRDSREAARAVGESLLGFLDRKGADAGGGAGPDPGERAAADPQ
ncbi:MAG: nucleoside phosphorylase [Opitutaceae bacterium]|jgi:adenosylhomocysteine nucleosidase